MKYRRELKRIEVPASTFDMIQRRCDVFLRHWSIGDYSPKWLVAHGYLQGLEDALQMIDRNPEIVETAKEPAPAPTEYQI